MSDMQDLYRELILDHSRKPRHFGHLEGATHTADGINALCGDKLTLYVQVDDKGLIRRSSFDGVGCAISLASASLMTSAITGLHVERAESCIDEIATRLTEGANDGEVSPELEKLVALDGVRRYPGRVKCATLAWRTLHAALTNSGTPATTE